MEFEEAYYPEILLLDARLHMRAMDRENRIEFRDYFPMI
jgi:hypothetical protein